MKEILISICVGSVVLSALMLLVPNEEKTLKYVIGVIFLCMLVLPIASAVPAFEFEAAGEQADLSENVLALKTKSTEQLIGDILQRNGIDYKLISVSADISDDYCITIKTARIVSDEDEQKIMAALSGLDFQKVVEKSEGAD